MTIYYNPKQPIERVVGDRDPIGAQLKNQAGTVVALTGKTIVFRMVQIPSGRVVINNQTATQDDTANGKVSYTPSANDVGTAGTYALYFLDATTTPNRRYPYDGARFTLHLKAETEE